MKDVKLMLELTQEEAKWVAENMQNPLHGQHPDEETELDATIRKNLFAECKKADV